MTVQPKLHISTAKARSELVSFCITAFMTCKKATSSQEIVTKGYQEIHKYFQQEVPLEPSSVDCLSKTIHMIVQLAEKEQKLK